MYGIIANIYHKNQPNVGEYTIPMDPMGTKSKFLQAYLNPQAYLYIYIILKKTARLGKWKTMLDFWGFWDMFIQRIHRKVG